MFTESMEASDGTVVLPSTQLYWQYNTNETNTIYDSEAPITTTERPASDIASNR